MSGSGILFVQPSFAGTDDVVAAQNYTGIPTPGIGSNIPAVVGNPTCQNLLSSSPPMLGQAFEVVAFSIPWGVYINNGSTALGADPTVTLRLELLRNSDVAYSITQQSVAPLDETGENANTSGIFSADIVNPVELQARDRLALQLVYSSDTSLAQMGVVLAAVYVPTNVAMPQQGTLSYDQIDLPARRRL